MHEHSYLSTHTRDKVALPYSHPLGAVHIFSLPIHFAAPSASSSRSPLSPSCPSTSQSTTSQPQDVIRFYVTSQCTFFAPSQYTARDSIRRAVTYRHVDSRAVRKTDRQTDRLHACLEPIEPVPAEGLNYSPETQRAPSRGGEVKWYGERRAHDVCNLPSTTAIISMHRAASEPWSKFRTLDAVPSNPSALFLTYIIKTHSRHHTNSKKERKKKGARAGLTSHFRRVC